MQIRYRWITMQNIVNTAGIEGYSTSHFAWCWDEIHGRFPFRFNSWLVGHGEEYCSTLDSSHWVRRNVKKKRGVSSVNWDPVCIRDWVVSCVKVCKSRIKSDLLEPCIWLINILNKDCWLFITPISPGPFGKTSTVTTRIFSLKTIE